jgi:hypothetical protein
MHLYLAVSDLLNYLTTANTNMSITMETGDSKDITMESSDNKSVTMEISDSAAENGSIESNDTFANEEKPVLVEADVILRWFWQGFTSLCLSTLQNNSEEKVRQPCKICV